MAPRRTSQSRLVAAPCACRESTVARDPGAGGRASGPLILGGPSKGP
ncbi:MAG: hypothetical protein LBE67_07385 [Kocuria palustris]|nr:hypothetical protein [Kocuria palustris]